ncbi:MAG: hypothetical protein H7068_13180 [Pedobacter sp.]|nr:hypothetical protein [Chitinophagaceae bacterium]
MKKVIFIIAGAMFTLTTMAQTTTPIPTQKQIDSKDLRKDIREKRADKRELKADIKAKNKVAAKAEVKEIKADNKDIHQDTKNLKAEGVKHPINRAEKQIHTINKHR